jgi:competence ComEA-like helix-hairpin-helix protein
MSDIRNPFNLKKSDRIGFITLSIIIIALITINTIIAKKNIKSEKFDFSKFSSQIDSFENSLKPIHHKYENRLDSFIIARYAKLKLFKFNPNNTTNEQWLRLGLTKKQIKTINTYKNRGGKFLIKDDFRKIYGIRFKQYQILKPYIDLPDYIPTNKNKYQNKKYKNNKKNTKTIPTNINIAEGSIEINSANANELCKLPGLKQTIANRIIKFRNKLGGFYNINQLKEVYGLKNSTFNKIKKYISLNTKNIKKININFAEYKNLIKHPYINKKTTIAILRYREHNGFYTSINQLINKKIIDSITFKKIKPYITVN